MAIFQIVSLSVVYLSIVSVAHAQRPAFLGSFGFKLKDYRFIVGIGRDEDNIVCLGSVITNTVIITLASCLDDNKDEEQRDEAGDYFDERRKRLVVRPTQGKSRRGKTKMKRRSWEKERRCKRNDSDTDVQLSMPYSLFRIDKKMKVFVRLAVDGETLLTDPDYKPLSRAHMWKNDVAILITSNPLNFTEVQPILPTTMNFGEYIKSLHEVMVNTMSCQVIGLVRHPNILHSPKSTDVELEAVDVSLLYDKCNNTVCFEEEEDCTGTGHHIFNDPDNPLPSFIGGSPLVCEGKLLSVINVDSHCDREMYSAEFAQPETVRGLVKRYVFINPDRNTSDGIAVPKIPLPTWATDASYAIVLNRYATFAIIILHLVEN